MLSLILKISGSCTDPGLASMLFVVKKFINILWIIGPILAIIGAVIAFIKLLAQDANFEGEGFSGDLAFSARDRINRAPQALGFINLKPTIQLTDVGALFVQKAREEEIFLRQLLKFQLPSENGESVD